MYNRNPPPLLLILDSKMASLLYPTRIAFFSFLILACPLQPSIRFLKKSLVSSQLPSDRLFFLTEIRDIKYASWLSQCAVSPHALPPTHRCLSTARPSRLEFTYRFSALLGLMLRGLFEISLRFFILEVRPVVYYCIRFQLFSRSLALSFTRFSFLRSSEGHVPFFLSPPSLALAQHPSTKSGLPSFLTLLRRSLSC